MSTLSSFRLLCLAGALALAAHANADSSASSASSAGSASSGSISTSLTTSSGSSSGDKKTANGAYEIIHIAAAPGRTGMTQVTMQGDTAETHLVLTLPQKTFDKQHLAQGDKVYATNRPYGIEFASNTTREAFFLVLADDWYGDMASRPVTL